MSDVLHEFFDKQTEEEKKLAQASVDNARSEDIIKLNVSGHYRMQVATFAFKDKDTQKMRTSPELKLSEKTKALMISLSLKVVDGTPQAPAGSSIFTQITLSPATGASSKKFSDTMSMMKPKITALTGEKNISITPQWIDEYLLPTFEEKDGKFILVSDHKMKNDVMVMVEDDVYQGKPQLKVTRIIKASESDVSVSNTIDDQGDLSGQAYVDATDVDPDEAIIGGEERSNTDIQADIPDMPTEPDDF